MEKSIIQKLLNEDEGLRLQRLRKIMLELDKETTPKQQHLIEIMCKKYLIEAHLMITNNKIIGLRKNKSLEDIFLYFMDSEALLKRSVKLKKRGPEKPMILLADKERQMFVSGLFIIEYIFGENFLLEKNEHELLMLIYKKITYEMQISKLDEELMKESIEEIDVLVKIVNHIITSIQQREFYSSCKVSMINL